MWPYSYMGVSLRLLSYVRGWLHSNLEYLLQIKKNAAIFGRINIDFLAWHKKVNQNLTQWLNKFGKVT